MGGGHDEREQTLNQMLVEMDGFDENQNVILIAATNRVDILDPALLRPGRFDRQIAVEAPDLKGRLHILGVHAKGKPLAHDVDLEHVAKRTIGMSGADLANVLNEAALLTARSGNQIIDNRALDEAIDRVSMGPQRYSKVMSERERQMTAYHEGGHALVAAAMNNSAPVTKVTILPRGRAGGYTMVVPTQDRNYQSRNELLDRLAYALGGYAVEESIFHDVTTGPSSDLQNATKIARTMVMQLGMSHAVGQVALEGDQEVFVGMQQGQGPPLQRRDREPHRPGGPRAGRHRARRGLGRHRGEPPRAGPPGGGAAREGDPERARARRDLPRREEAGPARGVGLERGPARAGRTLRRRHHHRQRHRGARRGRAAAAEPRPSCPTPGGDGPQIPEPRRAAPAREAPATDTTALMGRSAEMGRGPAPGRSRGARAPRRDR